MTYPHRYIIPSLILAGLAVNIWTILTWDLSFIANDGVQYVSTAGNWLAGKGFSTNALIYTPHFQGALPAMQTVWPSGYPFVIALTSKIGVDIETAALILNLIMHAAASVLVWLIILKMGVERYFAALCAFAFYFLATPWMYVSAGLTEPLFTTLILCSLYFLPNPKQSDLVPWIICGLFLSACILVRYSSVFVAFGTGVGIFTYMLIYRPKSESTFFAALFKPGIRLAVLIFLPTAVFAYLMYRMYAIVGTLDRYSGSKVPETITSTAIRWAAKTSELLGFSSTTTSNGLIANFSFLVFALLITILLVLFLTDNKRYLKPSGNNAGTSYFRVIVLVAVFHAFSLVVYLSYNSMQSSPLEVITRYLYQIYPTFYIIFCYILFTLFTLTDSNKKRTAIKVMTTVIIALYFFAQLNSLRISRPVYFRDSIITTEMLSLQVNDSATVKDFINRCFADDQFGKSLWSPHAQSIHLHTGVTTITQSPNYTDKPFNAENLQERINQYQIGMFVFVNFLDDPNEKHDNYMTGVKTWLSSNGYVNVPLPKNSFGQNRTVEIYSPDLRCDA